VKEQKPALGHFNVSEATSNGGGAESGSNVIIFVVHSGLPMDPIVALQDINAVDRLHDVPIKNCALLEYSKRQKVVTRNALRRQAGLGNIFRP